MRGFAIIADDLTGASDTGIQFSKHGFNTVVIINHKNLQAGENTNDVWSVNVDSRVLSAAEAYERNFTVARQLLEMGFTKFYKKMDSTLKGHPGTELNAVMDALNIELAMLTPAFPANGRIVIDGNLFLLPANTNTDDLKKVSEHKNLGNVPSLLRNAMKRRVHSLNLKEVRAGADKLVRAIAVRQKAGKQVFVLDAAAEEDLVIIAETCRLIFQKQSLIAAGAAGLANHLPSARGNVSLKTLSVPEDGVTLLVAGSRNPVTAAQIKEVLQAMEAPLVKVDTSAILSGRGDAEVERLLQSANYLVGNTIRPKLLVLAVDTLFNNDGEHSGSNTEGLAIVSVIGKVVDNLVYMVKINALIVTGGDTAIHICDSLGAAGIDLVTEILPGIPAGTIAGGKAHGLTIVTKAGGFGSPDAFLKVIATLK